jgi:hypothetical protein
VLESAAELVFVLWITKWETARTKKRVAKEVTEQVCLSSAYDNMQLP